MDDNSSRMRSPSMRYDVRRQNLAIDLTRMPALPNGRFIITIVMSVA